MVWMPLMNRKNMRRRKSQSPSSSSDCSPKVNNRAFFGSKNKRRILRKRDSTPTEASSLSSKWSIQTDNALWRVGEFSIQNIQRCQTRSTCSHYNFFVSCFLWSYTIRYNAWTENIRDNPPTADEWWQDVGTPETIDVYHEIEDGKITTDGSPKVVINTHVSSCHKKFHNCGFETWVRAREEWKQQTVRDKPERSGLPDRAQIIRGLRKATSQRTYELPRNIALPDLIHMYSDIWDGSHWT